MTAYDDPALAPPDTKIRLPLDGEPFAGEWVFARHLGGDRYRIGNVPIHTSEYGLHDVVLALTVACDLPECDDPDCVLEAVDVVERVTHVRFAYELPATTDTDAFFAEARALHVATECCAPRLYVSNLRDRTHAGAFVALLQRHAAWFEGSDLCGPRPAEAA